MPDVSKKEQEDRLWTLIGGSIVTGIGVLFLLINMDILPPMEDTWPIIMIIVGLALIIGTFVGKKKKSETEQ